MEIICNIDDCIGKLSCDSLSSILAKGQTIALELKDYDNWVLLRLQNSRKEQARDIKIKYIQLCLQTGKQIDSIEIDYKKVIDIFLQSRSLGDEKVFNHTAYELENHIAHFKNLITTLIVPEGLAPIDTYYESQKYIKAKIDAQNSLNQCQMYYSQIKNIISNILVDMRQKTLEIALVKTITTKNFELNDLIYLLNRFHQVVIQLSDRHSNRETLHVNDEYDVQDLLHSLLRIYYDDIRPEEWTPSYAGTSSRQDFLLKREKIVIETKKTRKGLGNKELANELIVDITQYKEHPDCKTLVCFVYDPENHIKNPRGVENDLGKQTDDINIIVVIRP